MSPGPRGYGCITPREYGLSRDYSQLQGPVVLLWTLGSDDPGPSGPGPRVAPAGSTPPPPVRYWAQNSYPSSTDLNPNQSAFLRSSHPAPLGSTLVPWLLGLCTAVRGVGSKPSRERLRAGTAETLPLWGSAPRDVGGRPASWRRLQTAETRDPPPEVAPWPAGALSSAPLSPRPGFPASPAGRASVLSSAAEARRTGLDPCRKAPKFWR